jgi:transcription factor SPN1
MEALRAKRRQDHGEPATEKAIKEGDEEKGYDSGDSYDSAEFVRTQADNDFIDMDDDDPDAINELYAEQRFDDERGDSGDQKKKKKYAEQRFDDKRGDSGDQKKKRKKGGSKF